MRYPLIFCTAVIVIILETVPAFAHNRASLRGDVEVEIVSDTGNAFQAILHQDARNGRTRIIKRYLETRKGENYGIVIRNNTPERIGLVIAVDGRNIISGKRSDLNRRENMYIVGPSEHARFDGWRTNSDEVHRFYFTTPVDSYTIRTFSDSSAMGVIAVAVYREKEKPQPLFEPKKSETTPAAPARRGEAARGREKALADESAGTGFGNAQYSPVVTVEFEPEKVPVQKTLLKYEWRETLCRKGILRCGQEMGNRLWDEESYAPYPPDYREDR